MPNYPTPAAGQVWEMTDRGWDIATVATTFDLGTGPQVTYTWGPADMPRAATVALATFLTGRRPAMVWRAEVMGRYPWGEAVDYRTWQECPHCGQTVADEHTDQDDDYEAYLEVHRSAFCLLLAQVWAMQDALALAAKLRYDEAHAEPF